MQDLSRMELFFSSARLRFLSAQARLFITFEDTHKIHKKLG
jgi:hypothetical protein